MISLMNSNINTPVNIGNPEEFKIIQLANIIKDFKNNKKVKIYFFTEEILASGGYWVATQGNKIFAKYSNRFGQS